MLLQKKSTAGMYRTRAEFEFLSPPVALLARHQPERDSPELLLDVWIDQLVGREIDVGALLDVFRDIHYEVAWSMKFFEIASPFQLRKCCDVSTSLYYQATALDTRSYIATFIN